MVKIKTIALTLMLLLLTGCSSLSFFDKPSPVFLQEEDRYFTLPAGTPVSLELDGKKVDMVFPYQMKIVSPSKLVKNEDRLNNALAERLKFKKEKNTWMKVITPALGIIFTIVTLLIRRKKFSFRGEVNA